MKKVVTNSQLRYVLSLIATLLILNIPSFCQSSIVETIYFKPNSFTIDKKYQKTLNIIAGMLNSDTFGYLRVFAFSDTIGSESHNGYLSEKRANAVYNYLKFRSKFDTTKVYVTWLGESDDTYDLHFPDAHKQQRCVDILVQFYRKQKNNSN